MKTSKKSEHDKREGREHDDDEHDRDERDDDEHEKDDHDNGKPGNKQPCFPPSGACFPAVPGAKHKLSREQKLAQLAEGIRVPSSIAAGTMHMARRFLRGKAAANSLEKAVFPLFRRLPKGLLSCTVSAFDDLPVDQRNRLFAEPLLLDLNKPLDEATLTSAFVEEIKQRAGMQVFGDPQALEGERPGQMRLFPPGGDDIQQAQVIICTINTLRTAHFVPVFNNYKPEELQQDCEIKIGETQPVCEVRTTDCPGNSFFDANSGTTACARVLDIAQGESVEIEGVNFFSVDTKVRFTDKQTGSPVRDVDAFVFGDIDTPVRDEGGVLINDCRVKDRLTFTIPEDLPSALYAIHIVVPNVTGEPGFGAELASNQEYINVIPPATARFEIIIEQIHCKEETSPEWAGSDELGIHTMAAAFDLNFEFINLPAVKLSPDGQPEEPSLVQDQAFREGNLDSGTKRDSKKLVFQHDQPILAMLLVVLGDEIDSEDAYENQITSSMEIFVKVIKAQAIAILAGLAVGEIGLKDFLKLLGKHPVLLAIAAAILIAVDIIYALWAPADPLIRDSIALTVNDLDALTNISVPAPGPSFPPSESGIRVNVNNTVPPEKVPTQYRETREYITAPDQDSRYEVMYRYNRVA